MRGSSGTVAVVVKVHCLCDVSCCLAVDQKGLKGSVLWMDITILITFYDLLGESAL